MNRVLRVLVSSGIAVCVAALVTTTVLAATYYISENTLYWISGPNTPPVTQSSGACVGGSCRYLYQSSNPSLFRWNYTQTGVINWYAYIPSIGQAAARYGVRVGTQPIWQVTVNQANQNNWGKYVYLGYSDVVGPSGYLMLDNRCVAGYWCGGLRVYWDSMKYTK